MAEPQVSDEDKRKIWVMRSRGFSYRNIGKAIGFSATTARAHYKAMCREQADDITDGGQQEILGELAMMHKDLAQEALRNMNQAEQGSPLRSQWVSIAGKRVDALTQFLFTCGMAQKAAEKVEIGVRNVMAMSNEEILRNIEEIQTELAVRPNKIAMRMAEQNAGNN